MLRLTVPPILALFLPGCGGSPPKTDDPPPAQPPKSASADPGERDESPQAPQTPTTPAAAVPEPTAALDAKIATRSGDLTLRMQCKTEGSCRADVHAPGTDQTQSALVLDVTSNCLGIGIDRPGEGSAKRKGISVEDIIVRVIPTADESDTPTHRTGSVALPPASLSPMMMVGNCDPILDQTADPPLAKRVLKCDWDPSRFVCNTTTRTGDGAYSRDEIGELAPTSPSEAYCIDACKGVYSVVTYELCECAAD